MHCTARQSFPERRSQSPAELLWPRAILEQIRLPLCVHYFLLTFAKHLGCWPGETDEGRKCVWMCRVFNVTLGGGKKTMVFLSVAVVSEEGIGYFILALSFSTSFFSFLQFLKRETKPRLAIKWRFTSRRFSFWSVGSHLYECVYMCFDLPWNSWVFFWGGGRGVLFYSFYFFHLTSTYKIHFLLLYQNSYLDFMMIVYPRSDPAWYHDKM